MMRAIGLWYLFVQCAKIIEVAYRVPENLPELRIYVAPRNLVMIEVAAFD